MEPNKVVNTEEVKNSNFQKTELTWDAYIDYLVEAINESNFMKRSEIKPMATPKDNLESHLTSRATHVRNAADIAKRITKGLGLNYDYAFAGMLMHDAGHPFGAHEGEETFTQIGEIYNVQYFHHNAKGIEVIESENICAKAISKIPNIRNNPELRKKLEEEFPYFLDIVVSHDGEASAKDMNKKEEQYPDMKTAVKSKVRKATAENNYKCIAQTPEGKTAKFADVIAYLATDIRDGFRLGIYKDFPEQYLELFGEMFADGYASTKEEKLQVARNIISEIQDEKLRELVEDARGEENKQIIQLANKITGEIVAEGINFESGSDRIPEIIEKHIQAYRRARERQGMSDEERSFLDSDVQKIEEFVGKKMRVSSAVVAEVTSRMQEFFINDLLKNSREAGRLAFSPIGQRLFFKTKQINYETYVPGSKWVYQKDAQPKAAYKLVGLCATSLVKSGAIANKFYDRSMRKYVTDPEALAYLKTQYRTPEEYQKYREKHDIRNVRTSRRRYTTTASTNKLIARRELFSNVYEYVQKEGEIFADRYMNTFRAIETQVRAKVMRALNPNYELRIGKDIENSQDFREIYRAKIDTDVKTIRDRFLGQHSTLDEATEADQEAIIRTLVEEERQKMEDKMAVQLAIDYLAGMTDRGFNELAIQTEHMKPEDLIRNRIDITRAFAEDRRVQSYIAAIKESEAEEKTDDGERE